MTLAPHAAPSAPSQLAEAVLRAASGLLGMQVTFFAAVDGPTLHWEQLLGQLDGLTAGSSMPLDGAFCGRMLAGGPSFTTDAELDPVYASTPLRTALGIRAYVGVPVRRAGAVIGTLGALDTRPREVTAAQVQVLTALARGLVDEPAGEPVVSLHRTASGWEVEAGDGSRQVEADLTVAMSLADLVAGETLDTVPAQRPQRPSAELDETQALKVQIRQLEHALSARVVIEQAIGVLAQRDALSPRQAFDRIRTSARSRGQRVHDLAAHIVRSARDQTVTLPADLLH